MTAKVAQLYGNSLERAYHLHSHHNAIFDKSKDKIAANLSLKPRNIICGLQDAEKIPKVL